MCLPQVGPMDWTKYGKTAPTPLHETQAQSLSAPQTDLKAQHIVPCSVALTFPGQTDARELSPRLIKPAQDQV